jgi:hypothetical protein
MDEDEGTPVLWKRKPYLAKPCTTVPDYDYLTCPAGHRYFVPHSELEDIDGTKAAVAWINAKKNSK